MNTQKLIYSLKKDEGFRAICNRGREFMAKIRRDYYVTVNVAQKKNHVLSSFIHVVFNLGQNPNASIFIVFYCETVFYILIL